MNTDDTESGVPRKSAGDAAYSLARAALSSIPAVGAAAGELLGWIVTPPLEQRRAEWMERVEETLRQQAAASSIDLEGLRSDPVFLDAVLEATHLALRTHEEEKLQALCSAVSNTAAGHAPEDSLRQMFMAWVDLFTVWHLRLLDLFLDPAAWARKRSHKFPDLMAGGLSHILESAYPELVGKREFYDQVWKDLSDRSLVSSGLHGMMSGHSLMAGRVTDLGKMFLALIREP